MNLAADSSTSVVAAQACVVRRARPDPSSGKLIHDEVCHQDEESPQLHRPLEARRPPVRLRWRAMNDFSARPMSLVDRIESDRSDPRLAGELEALRAAWRSLSPDERAAAADAARALAEAQAGAAPKRGAAR